MRNRAVQWVILLLILAGVALVIYQNLSASAETIREGAKAPDFTLKNLQNEEISLNQFAGKGVLINFWGVYCEPCRDEMPAIQRVYDEFKDKGFTVIGVNTGENKITVSSFIKQIDVNFPIVLDSELKVTKQYKIGPLPASIFVNPDGTIQKIKIGAMDENFIRQHVLKILP